MQCRSAKTIEHLNEMGSPRFDGEVTMLMQSSPKVAVNVSPRGVLSADCLRLSASMQQHDLKGQLPNIRNLLA